MNRFKDPSWLITVLLSITLVYSNLQFRRSNYISYDPFGYWLYLPQAFVAGDLQMKDDGFARELSQRYGSNTFMYQYHQVENGNHVLKYTMGMAVYYLPAFMVGHAVAGLGGYPQDGMSAPYQHAAFAWNILVSIIGLWALRRVLLHFFPANLSAWLLIGLFFGTNYLANVAMAGQNALSHNFLFTGYSSLVWLTIRWHQTPRMGLALSIGGLTGLMILARPTEAVCLLIPLLWGVQNRESLGAKMNLLASRWRQVVALGGLLLLIGLPQFIYWHHVTGHWLHTAYGGDAGEGFDWSNPHVMEVLLSFRKGWLVYTPLMVMALAGMVPLYFRKRDIFWSVTAYFLLNLYFLSAWSCWWYAYSFGQRVLIPAMAVMLIPMGLLAMEAWRWKAGKVVFKTLVLLCIALNVFQTYQYSKFIIHGDRMTKSYYEAVFLKTQVPPDAEWKLLADRHKLLHFPERYQRKWIMMNDLEVETIYDTNRIEANNNNFCMHPAKEYGPGIEAPMRSFSIRDHCVIEVNGRYFSKPGSSNINLGSVIHWIHQGQVYKYSFLPIDVDPGKWTEAQVFQISPELRDPDDSVKVYLWLRGQDSVWVEDFHVGVWERKESEP